ncbi:MAG: NADH-quinone oxidoreductase subunit L [Bryobacter sp.]
MDLSTSFWLIPFYPLVSAVLIGILRRGAALLAPLSVGLGFLHALAVYFLPRPARLEHRLGEWIPGASFGFLFDDLSGLLVLLVTGIGLLIHLYSLGYMGGKETFARYFGSLNLFVFFMLLLVMADNLLLLFAGWEGVGLASYLLIGFDYEKPAANQAANKAFLYNRAGDAGFLAGLFLLFAQFGTVEFAGLSNLEASPGLAAAGLLLALGASGKSAQFPLFVWLPDAMVGPTPVSALIHAATMVTAGVYLFARLAPLYAVIPEVGLVVAAFGAVTALIAATIALVDHDIKRILAYSTISQLGLMFLACGVGAPEAAMFHVATHAFFKALLFLCAGNIIHALAGEQDIRYMGGLRQSMPWTYRLMGVGALGLAGFPGLAGFFSKEAILHAAEGYPLLLALGLLVSFLTACYSARLVWRVFWGEQQQPGHDPHGWELHTLWPLAAGVIVAGYLGHLPSGAWWLLAASVVLALAGLYLGREMRVFEPLQTLFARKWFIDEIYRALWLRTIGYRGSALVAGVDEQRVGGVAGVAGLGTSLLSWVSAWVDRYLVDGLVMAIMLISQALSYPFRLAQTGGVLQYALFALGALAASMVYLWAKQGEIR